MMDVFWIVIDAQAKLSLRWAHLSEDKFSHLAA